MIFRRKLLEYLYNDMTIISRFLNSRNYSKSLAKNSPHTVTLNVIGTGAPGEPASICLSTPNIHYLFNAGEGCFRAFQQKQRNAMGIKHIFITQNKWNRIGGLLSIMKSIHRYSSKLPRFYGPYHLYKCVRRMFCLSVLSSFDFNTIESHDLAYFEDDALRIEFVAIQSNGETKEFVDRINDAKSLPRDDDEVFVYLCELKARRGGNKLEEPARDLCVGYQRPIHFMILDLPTKEHAKQLTKNQQFQVYLKTLTDDGLSLDIVVHFSSKKVSDLREYRSLVSTINPKLNLYLDERNKSSRLESVYELQQQLHEIDAHVHPTLKMDLERLTSVCDLSENFKIDSSQLFSTYYLRRLKPIETKDSKIDDLNRKSNVCLDRLKTYPKIVFFGTVSALPTPHRNSTSILVQTTNREHILLDCGEGTCGQIHRFYGKGAQHIFTKIKAVFLSHLHADHFIGLTELIQMRKQYLPSDREPLIILCPKANTKSWLFFYDNTIEAIHDDLLFIENDNLIKAGLSPMMCKKLGVQSLTTCRVPHFDTAHAVSLNIDTGIMPFKLTFSGDTTACDDLVLLGKNSTLLIHEATYSDERKNMAAINRHCTVSQAIEQSKRMDAKYTILTHFSRFRSTIPVIDTKLHPDVGVAFDFMELIEQDLPKFSHLYEKYHKLF